jgi:hypothetical protein
MELLGNSGQHFSLLVRQGRLCGHPPLDGHSVNHNDSVGIPPEDPFDAGLRSPIETNPIHVALDVGHVSLDSA